MLVVVLTARPVPAFAGQELLLEKGLYGPAEVIRAEFGNGDFTIACPNGVPDNIFTGQTKTDFYIVPSGTVDAGNLLFGVPIPLQYSSFAGFYDTAFASTKKTAISPIGVGSGTYDVVFDECQDGVYDAIGPEGSPQDLLLQDAFRVDIPTLLPLAAFQLEMLKFHAKFEIAHWKSERAQVGNVLKAGNFLLRLVFVHGITGQLRELGHLPAGSRLKASLMSLLKGGGLKLDEHLYLGLIEQKQKEAEQAMEAAQAAWEKVFADPPDPTYSQITRLPPREPAASAASGPLGAAVTGVVDQARSEGALADALVHSIERYSGAAAAGDGE